MTATPGSRPDPDAGREAGRWIVCVPARDEAERLGVLLEALAAQDVPGPVPVVVALNNTADASRSVVEAAAARFGRLRLTVDEACFPPALAHAGSARRRALQLGSLELDGRADGVLISTDADTRPPPDWISANLKAIDAGADLVGGRLALDEAEPLSPAAARLRGLWDAYWARVRRIEDAYDPCPHDPAPRHGDHTGASLAIRLSLHEAVGGVPPLPAGEDVAFVRAAQALGARLRHPEAVWTRVSPRRVGRAEGGMAEWMAGLERQAEGGAPLRAPNLAHWRARVLWRRAFRALHGEAARIEAEAALAPLPMDLVLAPVGPQSVERAAA